MNEQKLRKILSANIRRYRGYHNLSQADFAAMVNISISFLSDIENSKKWVSPKTLSKMADAFKIEVYELLRPEKSVPDDMASVLEKYSSEIYDSFGKNLKSLRDVYVTQLIGK